VGEAKYYTTGQVQACKGTVRTRITLQNLVDTSLQ